MEGLIALGGLTTLFVANEKQKKKSLKKEPNKKKIYTKLRSAKGFTKSVKRAVRAITLSPETKPVGSYKYKIHSYPSDIDIFEIFEDCCSLVKMQKTVASKFSQMAKNIQKNPYFFLGDFKAGIDKDLYFDYGELEYGEKLKIIGYKPDTIKLKLEEFKDRRWITYQEYNRINKMVKKNVSVKDFSKLHEEMRLLYLCRWKLDELISGKKKLRTGKYLTLEEAVTHKTIVKIDIWAPINGTYTEVTNVFYLILKDRSGNEIILNKELTDYVESLNGDINKYASIEFRNSLKVAKRMYIKNNLLGNAEVLETLYPLFYSGTASLNQVKEEMGVIIEMLEDKEKPNSKVSKNYKMIDRILKSQIDGFKKRINDIFDINFNDEKLYSLIDKCSRAKNDKQLIEALKNCINELKVIVEDTARDFLVNNELINIKKAKVGENTIEDEEYDLLY
jgi:hypothetical protein